MRDQGYAFVSLEQRVGIAAVKPGITVALASIGPGGPTAVDADPYPIGAKQVTGVLDREPSGGEGGPFDEHHRDPLLQSE
jgi:hypothetical protein